MRFTTSFTAIALASSLAQVQAYFLVATTLTGLGGPVGQTGNAWIRSPNLDCGTLSEQGRVNEMSDVSGDKLGVRLEWGAGDCKKTWLRDECPLVAEQHFTEFHQTWYADRGGDVVNLEGEVVGNCAVNLDTDKYCDVFAGRARYQSLLECTETA